MLRGSDRCRKRSWGRPVEPDGMLARDAYVPRMRGVLLARYARYAVRTGPVAALESIIGAVDCFGSGTRVAPPVAAPGSPQAVPKNPAESTATLAPSLLRLRVPENRPMIDEPPGDIDVPYCPAPGLGAWSIWSKRGYTPCLLSQSTSAISGARLERAERRRALAPATPWHSSLSLE